MCAVEPKYEHPCEAAFFWLPSVHSFKSFVDPKNVSHHPARVTSRAPCVYYQYAQTIPIHI